MLFLRCVCAFYVVVYLVFRKYEMSRTIKVRGEIFIVSLFTAGEGNIHKCIRVECTSGTESRTKQNQIFIMIEWIRRAVQSTVASTLVLTSTRAHTACANNHKYFTVWAVDSPRFREPGENQKMPRKSEKIETKTFSAEGRKKTKK